MDRQPPYAAALCFWAVVAVSAGGSAPPKPPKPLAMYTVNLGNYEMVHPVFPRCKGTDYYYFTDNSTTAELAKALGYTPVLLSTLPVPGDYVRSQRDIKARPHKYLPAEVRTSVYMDANYFPAVDQMWGRRSPKLDLQSVSTALLGGKALAVLDHNIRDCIYEEAVTVQSCHLDDRPEKVVSMMEKLLSEGYPMHHGLSETSILIRDHTHPAIRTAMSEWATNIQQLSRRDQLSFDYVLWKHRLPYNRIPRQLLWKELALKYIPHSGQFNRRNGLHDKEAPLKPSKPGGWMKEALEIHWSNIQVHLMAREKLGQKARQDKLVRGELERDLEPVLMMYRQLPNYPCMPVDATGHMKNKYEALISAQDHAKSVIDTLENDLNKVDELTHM